MEQDDIRWLWLYAESLAFRRAYTHIGQPQNQDTPAKGDECLAPMC
jgi:hypothetical protein